jgi:hypothetical protein
MREAALEKKGRAKGIAIAYALWRKYILQYHAGRIPFLPPLSFYLLTAIIFT